LSNGLPTVATTYYNPLNVMWPDLAFGRAFVSPARNGMDRKTGKLLQGWDHVGQSLELIFATPFHQRVLRRWVGSFVPHILGESLMARVVTRFYWALKLVSTATQSSPDAGRLACACSRAASAAKTAASSCSGMTPAERRIAFRSHRMPNSSRRIPIASCSRWSGTRSRNGPSVVTTRVSEKSPAMAPSPAGCHPRTVATASTIVSAGHQNPIAQPSTVCQIESRLIQLNT
jgi:hypothetical protein